MFSSIAEFWVLTIPFKRQLTIVCLLLSADALLTAFSVVTIAPLADLILEKPQSEWITVTTTLKSWFDAIGLPFNLISMTLLFFSLILSSALFSVVVRRSLVRLQVAVIKHLITESLEKMFAADWRYFSSTSRGVLTNTYIREISQTASAFLGLALSAAGFVKIFAFLIVPFVVQPVVVITCLIVSVIMVVPFMYMGKWSFRFGTQHLQFSNKYSTLLREAIEAAREVMSFGKEKATIDQISAAYQKSGDAHVRAATFNAFASQMYEPIGILIIITVLVIAKQTVEGLTLSTLAVVMWGLVRTIGPVKQLIQLKHNVDNKLPSLRQVLDEQNSAAALKQTIGTEYAETSNRAVKFVDVSFQYANDARGLVDCSFDSADNKMIALVGESGSGKSTIIDMILGLQRPSSGTVLLNGIDSRSIDLTRWRSGISLVSQKPVLFDLSIRDNLLWSNPDASENELWRICRVVEAAEFISRMPNGIDTEIGDSGIRLSGGQIQRIAMARALIRKPGLLILDEATSALDTETEAKVLDALKEETRDCLVIIVAHRLSTVSSADNILVIQQGKLVEQGNYRSLLHIDGYFSRLVRSQPTEKDLSVSSELQTGT